MTLTTFHAVLGGFAAVLGLLVGSFLNVCIARMPENRSVVWPPSACPACGHGIRPRDNIPVISWLILRARCRDCGTPISSLYPTVELLMGCLSWLLFQRFVPGPEAIDQGHLATFGLYFVFTAMLVAQTYIDIRHFIVPDEFSIYAVPVGVAGCALLGLLGAPEVPTWRASVVGALVGGVGLGSVALVYWLIRREEGMGLGDVKLLAMIGAFLGPLPPLLVVVLVASVSGAVVGGALMLARRGGLRTAVPFGPFLALGALVYVLHGKELVARFLPGMGALLEML